MLLPVIVALIFQVCQTQGYITYIAVRLPLQGDEAKPGSPWPEPQELSETGHVRTINPASFSFHSDLNDCDIMVDAFRRYQKLVFIDRHATKASLEEIKSLEVKVKNKECQGYPSLEMDESYTLNVMASATLTAETVWGALRGLETFSQLVFIENNTYMIRETYIQDAPRFPHRGSMVDSSRHYIPLPIFLKHLDAMSYNKLNVLHWHIVDDQSFPYVSKTFPELSQKAAFSPKHIYTPAMVSRIIEYARMRGIRVIPEFDTPGHAEGWGKVFRYLMTECWDGNSSASAVYSKHAAYENLDPTQNSTYDFLAKFYAEIKDVFKDKFLHLGQDEAHPMCWESSPNITKFMKKMGFGKKYYKLGQYFIARLLDVISGLGKRFMMWQDPLDEGGEVSKEIIVHVWKDKIGPTPFGHWQDYMSNLTAQGYTTLFSACWYLNYISYGEDWIKYYNCDPTDFDGTEEQKKKVIGGAAVMFAEFVDGTNFLSRHWPRASAVAERLWSPASVNDNDTARYRLDQHRCRMLRRGIPAEPIRPGFCGDYDYGFEEEIEMASPTTSPGSVVTEPVKGASAAIFPTFFVAFLAVVRLIIV